MGSPIPDTPLHQRRQVAVQTALKEDRKGNPLFSSKYLGLEKEVSHSTTSIFEDGGGGGGDFPQAEIHEGKVRMNVRLS
jgi:hypothetical protein